MNAVPDQVLGQLRYAQVQWLPGPLQRQMRENHDLLISLDEDAMLRPFRVRAGRAAPGLDMGGWYDADAFAPGATFGQWISALCRFHAITGDLPTRDKVHRLTYAYAATIELDGRFYRNNRFPAYIYDKLARGLLDAWRLARAESGLGLLQTSPLKLNFASLGRISYSCCVYNARALPMNTQPGSPVHTSADQAEWQVSPHYPDDLRRTCRWKSLVGSGGNWVGGIPQKDVIMGILELDAGGYYPAHAHAAPELYFVTAGEAEWTVGEETFTARPGVAIYHAPHTPHRMVNTGSETLRAIWFWWAPDGSAKVLSGEVYFTEAATPR